MQKFIKSFVRQPDGTWLCTEPATWDGPPRVQVTPGARFHPGTTFMGVDVAKMLEQHAKEETQAIVQRLFARAAERQGSAAALAHHLNVTYSELRTYISGEAMPPEFILLRAVNLLIDELPEIQRGFSQRAWRS